MAFSVIPQTVEYFIRVGTERHQNMNVLLDSPTILIRESVFGPIMSIDAINQVFIFRSRKLLLIRERETHCLINKLIHELMILFGFALS